MLALLLTASRAFSAGGGSGTTDTGTPILQSCDAISLCRIPDDDSGGYRCPDGMTKVAPPERSTIYQLETEDASTTYAADSLIPLTLSVTRKQIMGKRDRGMTNSSLESSKYIGLLLYAVRRGDMRERKVGSWEIPYEAPPRFWTPPDPGCAQRSLMHANAMPKAYRERFLFRAPAAGTGPIVFRALVKQGDTNAGAFYWLGSGAEPRTGVAGGDLTLGEDPTPPAGSATSWLRAAAGETCALACVRAQLQCDEAAMLASQSAASLEEAVEHDQVCRRPLLQEAACTAPSISTLVDGFCWYSSPAQCAAASGPSAASLCDAPAADSVSDMRVRLCPCSASGGAGDGRRLSSAAAAADEPAQPS